MDDRLAAALDRLSFEDAFRLMYGAYVYLRDLAGEVQSSTRTLLHRIRDGDASAVMYCVRKLLEEQDEVRLTLAGQHVHAGQSFRETVLNEMQQSLYWPCLLAVGGGVDYESIRLPEFFRAGLHGREPKKEELGEGGRDEVAIFRRALAGAGRAVTQANCHCIGPIEPREIALADLRQMAAKEYLAVYLRARLSIV